jgi:hypothetical protein
MTPAVQKDSRFSGSEVTEQKRLNDACEEGVPWKKWGPYLDERQWGNNNKAWQLRILAVALLLTLGSSGCEQTKISDINKNPGKFAGYEVTVAGTVTSTAASSNPGTFQVDDGSGRLWVLTTSIHLPTQGSRVIVTGLVESGVNLGSNSLVTTLQETKRYAGD